MKKFIKETWWAIEPILIYLTVMIFGEFLNVILAGMLIFKKIDSSQLAMIVLIFYCLIAVKSMGRTYDYVFKRMEELMIKEQEEEECQTP